MDQGLVAQAGEGTLGGALVGEGDSWRQWLVGHSLQVPVSRGPSRPSGALPWGPVVQGSQTGFPTSHTHQLDLGGSAVRRSQEVPQGSKEGEIGWVQPALYFPPSPPLS